MLPPTRRAARPSMSSPFTAAFAGRRAPRCRIRRWRQYFRPPAFSIPPLRAGIKAGDSWADTTKINSDLPNGPHQDGTILILWNVSATESGALAVDGAVTSNVTSTGQGGQRLTAIGSSKQHYIMAGPSVVRDATVESTTDASTVHEAGAAPVPSKNISTLKLTRLP